MKHWMTYPIITHPVSPDLLTKSSLTRIAVAAEDAGFDGFGFTDHPAPSHKWLMAGGHDALDPFVALSFVAAATDRLKLIPNIVVLPYRNPFVVAKTVATIDAITPARFVLSVATGYLRSEYRAVGVEYDNRNALFDEAIEVVKGVWANDDFAFTGSTFTASGVSANPKPAPGHVPIWIGGNSALTRRRVAQYGDGWNPFPAPAVLAKTSKTPVLEGLDDLAPMLGHLWGEIEAAGRDRAAIDVAFGTQLPGPGSPGFNAALEIDALARMDSLGVTWNGVSLPGDSVDHIIEAIDQYGREVIAPFN